VIRLNGAKETGLSAIAVEGFYRHQPGGPADSGWDLLSVIILARDVLCLLDPIESFVTLDRKAGEPAVTFDHPPPPLIRNKRAALPSRA
jgi:hypothetical protein